MVEALRTKRQCHICGRYGVQRFKWIPEVEVERTKVGGWWVCTGQAACRKRQWGVRSFHQQSDREPDGGRRGD